MARYSDELIHEHKNKQTKQRIIWCKAPADVLKINVLNTKIASASGGFAPRPPVQCRPIGSRYRARHACVTTTSQGRLNFLGPAPANKLSPFPATTLTDFGNSKRKLKLRYFDLSWICCTDESDRPTRRTQVTTHQRRRTSEQRKRVDSLVLFTGPTTLCVVPVTSGFYGQIG